MFYIHDKGEVAMMKKVLPLFLLLATVAVSPRQAQGQTPLKFKEGDRVEFDALETGDPTKAKWVKATVTKITVVKLSSTQSQTTYQVTLDPLPGRLPEFSTFRNGLRERGRPTLVTPAGRSDIFVPLQAAVRRPGSKATNCAWMRTTQCWPIVNCSIAKI